jgi:hypothetical protein
MKKLTSSRSFVFVASLAMAVQGLACNDSDAGPEAPEELEQLGEQAEALELPCAATSQFQYISAGNWIVCGTKWFDNYTYFDFKNETGSEIQVRLQSGPNLKYVTVPAFTHIQQKYKYWGGLVRIEPVGNSSVFVRVWS